jgi:hypothetical protein
MAFFKPRPGEPPAASGDAVSPHPAWAEPPPATFGIPVRPNPSAEEEATDERVVARAAQALVILRQIRAYPQGVWFELVLALQRSDPDTPPWNTREGLNQITWLPERGQSLPDELIRFGIDFRDGRAATDLQVEPSESRQPAPPQTPVLLRMPNGATSIVDSTGYQVDQPRWLWPLPPAREFDLVVEWPAYGVDLTRYSLDGAAINTAAAHAGPYWPDLDIPGSIPSPSSNGR